MLLPSGLLQYIPRLKAERAAVLLFFYCLRCLWLSSAQWLFVLKTNASQPAVVCWLEQRLQSTFGADVSSVVDNIFLCRYVWEGKEIGVRTAAVGILHVPGHTHSLANNIWGLSKGSIASRCSCHRLFSTVINPPSLWTCQGQAKTWHIASPTYTGGSEYILEYSKCFSS